MKKLVFALTLAVVLAGATAITASAGSAVAAKKKCGGIYQPRCKPGPRCGHLYQPRCRRPRVKGVIISRRTRITCTVAGNTFRLARVTVTAVAGLTKITIKLDGRTIATYRHLAGVRIKRVGGFVVQTHGLASRSHTIRVIAVDRRHRRVVQTAHFRVCNKTGPGFTG